MTPFLVLALPRSRTAWLSQFLTYGDWACGHDELRHMRGLEDVRTWFKQPNTGTIETSAAPYWRLIPEGTKVVTIRRPVAEVVRSLMQLGMPDMTPLMTKLDRKLDQIERRLGAMSVSFADLEHEETCARLFEHCLPYAHDPSWWHRMAPQNIQINMPALIRYCQAFKAQIDKLAAQAKSHSFAQLARRPIRERDDIVIQEENADAFWADAQSALKAHLVATGQMPDASLKNVPLMMLMQKIGCIQVMTARSNGRLFGYLLTVIGPSLNEEFVRVAEHIPFYASPEFPGLGMKLQRAAEAALIAKGVVSVVMRAGTLGSGPRLGSMYRRLGAEDHGHLYIKQLRAA